MSTHRMNRETQGVLYEAVKAKVRQSLRRGRWRNVRSGTRAAEGVKSQIRKLSGDARKAALDDDVRLVNDKAYIMRRLLRGVSPGEIPNLATLQRRVSDLQRTASVIKQGAAEKALKDLDEIDQVLSE